MKKAVHLLMLAMVSLAVMTSCDPSCNEEYVVKNLSGHDVVVTRYYTLHSGLWNNWQTIEDSVRCHIDTLMDGTDTKWGSSRLGTVNRESIEYYMKNEYWSDSVVFAFSNGTSRTFCPDSDTVWGPYAFGSTSYTYEEQENEDRIFRGMICWARLTYTFTAEDYERCQSE